MKNCLKVQRAILGMTQQQLADAIGVTRQTINSIEADRYVPSTVLALKLSQVFNKTVNELFQLEKDDWDVFRLTPQFTELLDPIQVDYHSIWEQIWMGKRRAGNLQTHILKEEGVYARLFNPEQNLALCSSRGGYLLTRRPGHCCRKCLADDWSKRTGGRKSSRVYMFTSLRNWRHWDNDKRQREEKEVEVCKRPVWPPSGQDPNRISTAFQPPFLQAA